LWCAVTRHQSDLFLLLCSAPDAIEQCRVCYAAARPNPAHAPLIQYIECGLMMVHSLSVHTGHPANMPLCYAAATQMWPDAHHLRRRWALRAPAARALVRPRRASSAATAVPARSAAVRRHPLRSYCWPGRQGSPQGWCRTGARSLRAQEYSSNQPQLTIHELRNAGAPYTLAYTIAASSSA